MIVDATLTEATAEAIARQAAELATAGYGGIWSSEVSRDAFLQLMPAAGATASTQLGTSIAVAFARTPMTMAYLARDLQAYSRGRFVLGMGSQVRPHIERRFSMPWSRPAARMREYIEALRAIWAAWETGDRLNFQGDFYTHTLMTPFFTPPADAYGRPPVYLAAVGDLMTEIAGEVADGLLTHPFTTASYVEQRTLPTLARGLERSGRARQSIAVSLACLVVTGRDEAELAAAAEAVRGQLAFYGSTPAYRRVLEHHGWGDLGDELNTLSRSDRPAKWDEMRGLVDEDVLAEFAVVAAPDVLGDAILARFGAFIDRVSFYAPYPHELDLFGSALETLSATPSRVGRKAEA